VIDAAASTRIELLTERDREALIRLWTEPVVRAYLGGVLAREDAQKRADAMIADRENAWAIRNRAHYNDALLGLLTLDVHCDLNEPEISYLLLPEFHGCGDASAAVALVCDRVFATRGVARIVAETQCANGASIRLLERLRFEHLHDCERFQATQSVYALDGQVARRLRLQTM
jgi:[ribosomal protein S5]-alanine N-acetyltransferase